MRASPASDARYSLSEVMRRYSRTYTIVSPPRCSSTALARVLWEHPDVGFYCHEPFEVRYYLNQGLAEVGRKLIDTLDLKPLKRHRGGADGRALVIKEMPYQVGRHFPLLAALSARPLIFLMRDPRLSIASRMAMRREVGNEPTFPRIESGWELWAEQIRWCRAHGIDHLLVDSTDYRNRPLDVLPQLFDRLGLEFKPEMLKWRACPDAQIDNLGGDHAHLYRRVLDSKSLNPADETIPPLNDFPATDGWRDHVARCLAIYREFGISVERIMPAGWRHNQKGARFIFR